MYDKKNTLTQHPARAHISLGIHLSDQMLCYVLNGVAKDLSFLHEPSMDFNRTGQMSLLVEKPNCWFCGTLGCIISGFNM